MEMGVNAVKSSEDMYLDLSRMEKVDVISICARRPTEEELKREGIFPHSYIVEEGNGGRCSHSDMELLTSFANNIESISAPIFLDVQFDYDKKKYPYNDPRYGLESVASVHNSQAYRYHLKIDEKAGNPFSARSSPCITEEQADMMIEEASDKKRGRFSILE